MRSKLTAATLVRSFSVSLLIVIAIAFALRAQAGVSVTDLRCEDRTNPEGIDAAEPLLGWSLESDQHDQKQSAYQILVASSEENLKDDDGNLWDSGKVLSDASIKIPYSGTPLASATDCFWKVRVWDGADIPSDWSRAAHWSVGLLQRNDWTPAQWIGLDGQDTTNVLVGTSWIWAAGGEPQKAAPPSTNYFRKIVVIPADRRIIRAHWVYTGDNECRGWLNGFDLGARNSVRSVKDNDITGRLQPGTTNVFAYTGTHRGTKSAGLIGLLTVEFDHGAPLVVQTDGSWKVSGREAPGWTKLGFDDSRWASAQVLGPANMQPWGSPRVAESRTQPARYLRKEFAVNKKVTRAIVFFSGLGLSELYLNGSKVGDAVLSPAFSQYDKRAFYVTYDVTKNVQQGTNAIGVILGNGRFYADRSRVYSGTKDFGWPKLLLKLRIEYDDGSAERIVSDISWKLTLDGPIRANNDFDGEEYDARMELDGWDKAGFNDSKWTPVRLVSAPGDTLSAQIQEPIRVTGTLKAKSMREIAKGVYVFDLGQNIAGWCRLHVSGPTGTRVTLRHAETLNSNGSLYVANLRSAKATDVYTLRGNGAETWEPRFITHGFRYVELTGFPGKPDLNSIEGCVVNDDLAPTGEFESSNPLLNQIYQAVVWGVRDNYRSIPTDCPQRDERQGWLGDRSAECRGESFLFDNSLLYSKWMQDIADSQRPSGSLPDVAPTYWSIYSDNVSWPSTFIMAPEMLRLQFSDTRTISRQYDAAKRWMDYISQWVTNGIIGRDSYGDWCVPPEDPLLIHSKDPNRITDKTLIATAYLYHDCRLMANNARLLNKTNDAEHFSKLAEQLKAGLNQKFLDRDKGQYSNGTQTSCVLPLAFGMVPDDMKTKIFAHLVNKIENETHSHIGTGLVGGQFLMRVLTENGRPDLAYTIATQRDYPSWGYMIEHGATTIWELWNGNTADPTMNSGNHVMLVGDLVIWLYENIAGIKSDPGAPGFKHILMKPTPVGDLTYVKASHRSPYGLIRSEWHREKTKFDWNIEIPVNTTATVSIPAGKAGKFTLDGKPVSATVELGSGKYHIVSE